MILVFLKNDLVWPTGLAGGLERDPEQNFACGDFRKTPISYIIILNIFNEERVG